MVLCTEPTVDLINSKQYFFYRSAIFARGVFINIQNMAVKRHDHDRMLTRYEK